MLRTAAIALAVTSVVALVIFLLVLRQISFLSTGIAAHAETRSALQTTLDDQKRLAKLDPAHRAEYHARFDRTHALLQNLDVVDMTHTRLTRTVEALLASLVAIVIASSIVIYVLLMRDRQRRLANVRVALGELSAGRTDIAIDDARRDSIGAIARMIEETSHVMAADQRRIQNLEHLSAWQEAARRHAHEIRTPLTAVRMEVEQVISRATTVAPEAAAEWAFARTTIMGELDQLRDFTSRFTSFAKIGEPNRREVSVTDSVGDFCTLFGNAWPHLTLRCSRVDDACVALVDPEMLRQVFVNLCTNSSQAIGEERGTVTFTVRRVGARIQVDVDDDGPGIDPAVRSRLFQPYVTTRTIGHGMGLGLAISKKIMLDHRGDLELIDSASGARFRVTMPAA